MVAMDFDWTLVEYPGGRAHVPQETQQALARLAGQGMEVGIATGRPWSEVRSLLDQAGVPWGQPFPTFLIAREMYIHWLRNGELQGEEEWNKARRRDMDRFGRAMATRAHHWFDILDRHGLRPYSWFLSSEFGFEAYFSTDQEAVQACRLLEAALEGDPQARLQRNRRLAHVTLASASKGRSLLEICRIKGIQPHQVLAIGDSLNDLDMLDGTWRFQCGAVGNADPLLKEAVARAGGLVVEGAAGVGVVQVLRAFLGQV